MNWKKSKVTNSNEVEEERNVNDKKYKKQKQYRVCVLIKQQTLQTEKLLMIIDAR